MNVSMSGVSVTCHVHWAGVSVLLRRGKRMLSRNWGSMAESVSRGGLYILWHSSSLGHLNPFFPNFSVPPHKVVISGPKQLGSSTPESQSVMRCESAHANPAPKLTFQVLDSHGKDVLDQLHNSGSVIIRRQETK